jgi:ribosomal protein S18 acetylase RimI-like enzyme
VRAEVRVEGRWPDPVQLRRGWAAARARAWNDESPTIATLRLERGSDRFVSACCDWLFGEGLERILSPAVTTSQGQLWRRAGFSDHLELIVFERSLRGPVPVPDRPVAELPRPDLDTLVLIDYRAFDGVWRVGRRGLEDAIAATASSTVMAVDEAGSPAGFVIVGETGGVAFLQRLAVDPAAAGRGIGTALVRAAISWAGRRGARTMLLNTQPENSAAARLYESG